MVESSCLPGKRKKQRPEIMARVLGQLVKKQWVREGLQYYICRIRNGGGTQFAIFMRRLEVNWKQPTRYFVWIHFSVSEG